MDDQNTGSKFHRFLCPHCLDFVRAEESIYELCVAVNDHNRQMHCTDKIFWTPSIMEHSIRYMPPTDDFGPVTDAEIADLDKQRGPMAAPRHEYIVPYVDRKITAKDREFLKELLVKW